MEVVCQVCKGQMVPVQVLNGETRDEDHAIQDVNNYRVLSLLQCQTCKTIFLKEEY